MTTSFPVFQSDAELTMNIDWLDIARGYVVILFVVLLVAGMTLALGTHWLNRSDIAHLIIYPGLDYGRSALELLSQSYRISWIGALLSLPVVIWARRRDFFGWGTALLTGIGLSVIVPLYIGNFNALVIWWIMIVPLSALLGLVFWLTIRFSNYSAFTRH